LAGAPAQLPFGVKMIGPVLMRFGSPQQQQYFLPRILSGEHWWCQGFSEPGAGSDLASLKTQAVLQSDHYVINGQKVWNTFGQHADWIFCLVRTDPTVKPQRGISFLLVDMKSPGITLRPTRLLDGSCEVNEIWFENVRVPTANRVGDENQGWTYAKYLLGHERTSIGGVGPSKLELSRLKRMAAFTHVEQARSMAYLAASRCELGDPVERSTSLSSAKVIIGQAARFVGQQAVQLHGGMGVSDELGVSHYFKRLLAAATRFGTTETHLERYARNL
jgi:alkylation response protein AidB-like acyl-CoA dehydrogenase